MNYWYVYQLESLSNPGKHYTGITQNLEARLKKYNAGDVPHTSKFKPWRLEVAISFRDEDKARDFERYLKSHSGRAFSKKHF